MGVQCCMQQKQAQHPPWSLAGDMWTLQRMEGSKTKVSKQLWRNSSAPPFLNKLIAIQEATPKNLNRISCTNTQPANWVHYKESHGSLKMVRVCSNHIDGTHLRAPTWEWPTLSRYSSESYRLSWETPSPHETSDGENHSELCYICIEVWIWNNSVKQWLQYSCISNQQEQEG